MKGDGKKPKQCWNCRDLEHQHFTESTGWKYRDQVKKGDRILIYFPVPGHMIFMGLHRVAEDGPHGLSRSVPGADLWPWGFKVKDHVWIPYRRLGIGLHESKTYLPGRPHIVRDGLAPADGWGSLSSIQALIEEIERRGEDPSIWKLGDDDSDLKNLILRGTLRSTISSRHRLTGTIGSVVKIRWLKSISRATPVNLDPSGALQRTNPTNSAISVSVKVSVNTSVMN